MTFIAEVLLEEGNLAIPTISGAPTGNGVSEGQLIAQNGPNDRKGFWRWNGSAWTYFPLSPIFGDTSPLSSITPNGKGQQFFNSTDSSLWLANGTSSSDWVQISGGGGPSSGPFAHWTLNDNTWADAIGGRSLTKVGSGTINIVTGQMGNAAQFPDYDATYLARTNVDMSIGGGNWEFQFYVKFSTLGLIRRFIEVVDASTESIEVSIMQVDYEGSWILSVETPERSVNSSVVLSTDTWYQVRVAQELGSGVNQIVIEVDGTIDYDTFTNTPVTVFSPELRIAYNDSLTYGLTLDDIKLFK